MTRKQHVVWRGYLKRWTKDLSKKGKIYVLRKTIYGAQPRIEYISLCKIGFRSYYYDLLGKKRKITESDYRWVSDSIDYIQKDNKVKLRLDKDCITEQSGRRDFVEDLMCDYERIELESRFIDRIIDNDLTFFKDTEEQSLYNKLQERMIKQLYGMEFENEFSIDRNTYTETCSCEGDLKHDFLRFVFMQMQRSPRYIERIKGTIEELKKEGRAPNELNTEFVALSLMLIHVELFATNGSTKLHTWLERLENRTDIPFVTSDCPVVNLTGDEIGEKHEFYYPLSPRVAVKLCSAYKMSKNGKVNNHNIVIEDKKEIDMLNSSVAQEAFNEIYADRMEVLSSLEKKLKM